MKTQYILKVVALAVVAAVALFAGCKKEEGHAAGDGHGHGEPKPTPRPGMAW